jgi:aspartate/methionine/tyrosine aminotransferase
MFKNLTGYEIDTLSRSFNLTDGHAFRRWLPAEEGIIERSAQLFRENDRRLQVEIEREYVRDFSRLGKQTFDEGAFGYLMCFTASMAFEIVANHLRLNQRSVALIEPCFDNLADIFRRHHIPMRPLADHLLEAPGEVFERALRDVDADAICIVTPNNPTGLTLSEENLRRLAAHCKERGKLLILDNCFRAYLPRDRVYDQYAIVREAGIDAVLVEDTGKTWPTSEIKAPFFAVSRQRGLFESLYDIYTDFLLHVSPVGVRLAHEFIRLSQADDMASIHQTVAVNRKALYEQIAGTFLTPCERPFASVAWLRIEGALSGVELKQILDRHGVFVLPGVFFFWHDRHLGDKFIRVALTRDADVFREATALLGKVCREIAGSERVEGEAGAGGRGVIAVSRDVRQELADQGFSFIRRSEWSIEPPLVREWERLSADWDHLELDRHLRDGATFRRRRYGRYFWSPQTRELIALPPEPYFQDAQENAYAGGVAREFAPLLPDTIDNPFLRALVAATFGCLPLDDERRGKTWEVRVHQIRVVATPEETGLPAPEGIHQDGTDFLTLHLVKRENVAGAQSTIYDLQRRPLRHFTMTEPLDSMILQDPRIMHGVTPVEPADGRTQARRDLLGIDFIFSPELRRPSEPSR